MTILYLGGENLAGHYLRGKINRYKPTNLSIINLRTPVVSSSCEAISAWTPTTAWLSSSLVTQMMRMSDDLDRKYH